MHCGLHATLIKKFLRRCFTGLSLNVSHPGGFKHKYLGTGYVTSSFSNLAVQLGLITRLELLIDISFVYWEICLGFYPVILLMTKRTNRRKVNISEYPPLTKELTKSSACAFNALRTGLLNCLNALSRGLTFRHVHPVYRDRRFATLQRTLFIYLINKYISLSDICLTVHH